MYSRESWCCLLFSLLLNVIGSSPVQELNLLNPSRPCSHVYDFDYLLLAIQWPPSYCKSEPSCRPHDDSWSIHGIWPQLINSSTGPEFCCFDKKFDINNVKDFRTQLEKKWMTLDPDMDDLHFWQHEWEKHGTCTRSSPELRGQKKYFNKTLELFDTFSLKEWLSEKGIEPSNSQTYAIKNIHQALESKLGVKVDLECSLQKHNHLPLLQTILICLDGKTLEPINCLRGNIQCGKGFIQYPSSRAIYEWRIQIDLLNIILSNP